MEDRMVKITAEEQNKAKRMQGIKGSLRYLWGNIKSTNNGFIVVPEKKRKRKILTKF